MQMFIVNFIARSNLCIRARMEIGEREESTRFSTEETLRVMVYEACRSVPVHFTQN